MGTSSNDTYFTICVLEDDTTIEFTAKSYNESLLYYRIDDGDWKCDDTNPLEISRVKSGQKIQFKMDHPITLSVFTSTTVIRMYGIGTFYVDKPFNVEGNIMSLLYGDGFINKTDFIGEENKEFSYAFYELFANCENLINAKDLKLPATTLTSYCYQSMFHGCTSLVTTPELPATTLSKFCYGGMFDGCTSLTIAPILPATTLAEECYYGMFKDCTSLTTVELPATTLAATCYYRMFYGCTSLRSAPTLPASKLLNACYAEMFYNCNKLNYIKMLATDIPAGGNCLSNWVYGVATSGTFVKQRIVDLEKNSAHGIPKTNWSVIYPEHNQYFTILALEDGLTSSLSVNDSQYRIDNGEWVSLPARTKTPSVNAGQRIQFKIDNPTVNTNGMGTFSVNKMFNAEGNIMSLLYGDNFVGKTEISDTYGSAFCYLFNEQTTLKSTYNLVLPAIILSSACYKYMFSGCTSLIDTPELPAVELKSTCYYYMFRYCTALTTAPVLPATTLANYCYEGMFYECTGLKNAPALPATTLEIYCYKMMFCKCTSLEATPELPAPVLKDYCYAGLFQNCTKVKSIKLLSTNVSANQCFNGWTDGINTEGKLYIYKSISSAYIPKPLNWEIEYIN